MRRRKTWIAPLAATLTLMMPTAASAQGGVAPGAPGASANWTTGNKQGLGTSVGTDSKVWYTLSGGALSEVYFPSGDAANVRSLEFAVTDGAHVRRPRERGHGSRGPARGSTVADLRAGQHGEVGPLSHHQDLRHRPERETVLMRVRFEPLTPGDYRLFVLYDPALRNSSLHDTASTTAPARRRVAGRARAPWRARWSRRRASRARRTASSAPATAGPTSRTTGAGLRLRHGAGRQRAADRRDAARAGSDDVHARARLRGVTPSGREHGARKPGAVLRRPGRRLPARLARVSGLAPPQRRHDCIGRAADQAGEVPAHATRSRAQVGTRQRSVPRPRPRDQLGRPARRYGPAHLQPAPVAQGEAGLVRAGDGDDRRPEQGTERQAHQGRSQPSLLAAPQGARQGPRGPIRLPCVRAAGERNGRRQLPLAAHPSHAAPWAGAAGGRDAA